MISVNSNQTLQHKQGATILESLEEAQIEVHFHCREGFCGACRTKLKKGEVQYRSEPLAYIDDDEILPCCCSPTSHIEIEVE